jgi:predicted nucleotidyltransferase
MGIEGIRVIDLKMRGGNPYAIIEIMDREKVLELLRSHAEEIKRLGVINLSLFGSVARNEAGLQSDVDLLVTMQPPFTFDRYIQAKFYLEDLLGCPVDLVMDDTLKPRARLSALREAIRVA